MYSLVLWCQTFNFFVFEIFSRNDFSHVIATARLILYSRQSSPCFIVISVKIYINVIDVCGRGAQIKYSVLMGQSARK